MAGKRRPKRLVHAELLRRAHRDGTYELLLEGQRNECAICTVPDIDYPRRFDIDHNHKTLRIRGLLCRGCNMRLRRGLTPGWLRAAANYLERAGE